MEEENHEFRKPPVGLLIAPERTARVSEQLFGVHLPILNYEF